MYTQSGWSKFAIDHLLDGPNFGRKWKNVPDAQCQSGGFDKFLIATNWLVLQFGGGAKHVHTKRVVEFRDGWPPGAAWHLHEGTYWPLLWARVTASAVMAVFIAHWCQDPNSDFRL
jgi:hypothetical protein